MGHQINHYTTKVTSEKSLKAWISQITDCAYDPQESSSYHGNLTIHKNKVYKDYDEALAAIEKYDNGWYDDHIVKYYDLSDEGRKKVQEWNKKRDAYIEAHSIHKRTSKYIGCPECGSKLNLAISGVKNARYVELIYDQTQPLKKLNSTIGKSRNVPRSIDRNSGWPRLSIIVNC